MIRLKQTETFRKWERKLADQKAKALIAARLYRLAHGLAGDVSPVGEGISELRIHYGPGYRVYFQRRGGDRHSAVWWRQRLAGAGYQDSEAARCAMERMTWSKNSTTTIRLTR